MHLPTLCPDGILACEVPLVLAYQKQPTTARNKMAVVQLGKLDKFHLFFEGFRRRHKLDSGSGQVPSDNHHTILLLVYRNQRSLAEKEGPTRPKVLYKGYMSRLGDQTLY
jgi:hypothetical protein